MDQDSKENKTKKRARETDSEINPPESKLTRVGSSDSVLNGPDEPDSPCLDSSGVNSPDAKRIQDDLFNILDDADEPSIQGLDSVIKSFEEEILVPVTGIETVEPSGVTSCGVVSQPDLGYLLEASDDELGLPPTFLCEEEKVSAETETSRSEQGNGCFGEMIGFENEMPSYDSFDLGFAVESVSNSYNDSGDFVALGGLFNYSDENYVPADITGVQWQPESLPAS